MISSNMERLENSENNAIDKKMEIMKKKIIRKEKRKQDMINKRKLLKQQQLTREINMGIHNTRRFGCIWRQKMIEVKIPEMKIDIEVAKSTFDRILDIKVFCGNLLLECLDKCEEQYQRNVNHHMDIIKKFEQIYGSRLEAANDFYDRNLVELIEESNSDVEKIEFLQYDDEIFLETLIFQRKNQQKNILDNLTSENVYKLENLRSTGNNVTKIAMVHLAENISSMWDTLNIRLSKYLKDIEDRQVSYLILKEKDDKNREIIARQLIKTAELIDSMVSIKAKIVGFREESKKRISETFLNEYSLIDRKKKLMKEKFDNEQILDKFQLNLLTTQYNLTIQHLQNLIKKSSMILFLIRSCQKLQINSEKLYPGQINQIKDEFDYYEFFWYRVGLAESIMKDYQRKKEILLEENSILQENVKQWMNKYSKQ